MIYTILHYAYTDTILYYTELHCTVQHYTTLHYTITYQTRKKAWAKEMKKKNFKGRINRAYRVIICEMRNLKLFRNCWVYRRGDKLASQRDSDSDSDVMNG